VDVVEGQDSFTVKLDLPGHDPKDIQITVENDVLTVRSERKAEKSEDGRTYHLSERCTGVYARSFELPSSVDGAKTEARYENGVLAVTLPKREEAKPKSVTVKVKG